MAEMKGVFDTHSKAINDALDALFDAIKAAERDGFDTHIYVPEGGSEVATMATIDLSLSHAVTPRKRRKK